MTGIYVHVPFCERKCPYCAFYSVPCRSGYVGGYMRSLLKSIAESADNIRADTLYFGGGTPALLGPENIGSIIEICRQRFGLDSAEITLECNPNSIDRQKLKSFRAAGVNRLSVGVQSLDDGELAFLGRLHNRTQALDALRSAREAGFENISADLMIGIKGQTPESIGRTVDELSSLGALHLSVYMIKVEPGTPFDCDTVRDRLMDEDALAELYLGTVEAAETRGFRQYEISNFAVAGYESRHNCKYWEGEEYLGFGPAAHSFYKGIRYCCPGDLEAFIASGPQMTVTDPAPDPSEEYVMLGLRLCKGISLDKLASLGAEEDRIKHISLLAERYASAGLCVTDGRAVRLTPKGMLVSNSVIASFLS